VAASSFRQTCWRGCRYLNEIGLIFGGACVCRRDFAPACVPFSLRHCSRQYGECFCQAIPRFAAAAAVARFNTHQPCAEPPQLLVPATLRRPSVVRVKIRKTICRRAVSRLKDRTHAGARDRACNASTANKLSGRFHLKYGIPQPACCRNRACGTAAWPQDKLKK